MSTAARRSITIEPTAVNSNGTQYTTSDQLGSPRVITNASGAVMSRHDYQPFGAELGAGVGSRTTAMGFGGSGDDNRKKFTGYERDTETGLDFAQVRYFSSTQGRFTSPDSMLGSIGNPQTLNRYAYVGNNPLNFSDPTGHTRFDASSSTGGDQGGYMSPNNPDFDPGTLPQRDEDEIARIKALIADTGATAGPYAGDGIVDTNAGETAAGEASSISSGQPQETAQPQENGKVKVKVRTTTYEITNAQTPNGTVSGLQIRLLAKVKGGNYQHFNWIQYVTTNAPLDGDPANQPVLDRDRGQQTPFYNNPSFEQGFFEERAHRQGGSTIFSDNPGRYYSGTRVVWRANLSLVGIRSDGTFDVLRKYSYGFTLTANGVHLGELRRIQ